MRIVYHKMRILCGIFLDGSLAKVNKIFIFDYLVKVDFFQLIDMDRKIFLFLPLPGMVLHLVLRNAASIRRILGGCWEAIGRLS